MPKRKTQEEFIKEAQAKHSDFSEYRKVGYVNSATKVIIICPKHGDFEITPSHHLDGVGCRKCYADRTRNAQGTIIARFHEAHGDHYNYEKVIYERCNSNVTIVCSVHGDFQQTPSAHIAGSGCPKCAVEGQALTTKDFIQKARAKHGAKYNYGQVQYVNNSTKVTISCPQHGLFAQNPNNHLRGNKCPKCVKESITEAKHGFEYKGISYRSIKHACQKLIKDYWVVLKRLDAGWNLDQAFDNAPHNPRHPFEVNGIVYNGIEDAVRQLNAPVSSATVRRRLAEGMNSQEALFTPPKFGYDNGVIYAITNLINGKQYVGLTTTSLEERWDRHLEQVSRKEASLIHKAITLFGEENFTLEQIAHASSIKELRVKERELIQTLNTLTPNGYNVTLGGEVGGAPGKITKIPGDPTLYPSMKAAAQALARREGIGEDAAEWRIRKGRIDVKKPHGMSKTRIYRYWDWLVHQLANPKSNDYNGSSICSHWKEFANFYEDISEEYKEGLRLKMINPNLPYSKDNCAWVTISDLHQTHGMTGTKFYQIWARLKHYRTNPNAKKYEGTALCRRWQKFENFKADMYGSYEEGMGLKLINSEQPYSKENCKWMNKSELRKKHPAICSTLLP